ncbi:hypothetical protein F5Y18DRAFT_425617 [Xylariaceae sp. FL1019]|nr:hypothetical protein F5Y18DRAFT_425617 [Xylariaceae sp. FL1019]
MVAKTTLNAPATTTPHRPLHTFGVDSLLAVELSKWFKKSFQADVAISDITGRKSLEQIADIAARASDLLKKRQPDEAVLRNDPQPPIDCQRTDVYPSSRAPLAWELVLEMEQSPWLAPSTKDGGRRELIGVDIDENTPEDVTKSARKVS